VRCLRQITAHVETQRLLFDALEATGQRSFTGGGECAETLVKSLAQIDLLFLSWLMQLARCRASGPLFYHKRAIGACTPIRCLPIWEQQGDILVTVETMRYGNIENER